jgi:uncharacterized membrane protein YfbV (UPF0208 family)
MNQATQRRSNRFPAGEEVISQQNILHRGHRLFKDTYGMDSRIQNIHSERRIIIESPFAVRLVGILRFRIDLL